VGVALDHQQSALAIEVQADGMHDVRIGGEELHFKTWIVNLRALWPGFGAETRKKDHGGGTRKESAHFRTHQVTSFVCIRQTAQSSNETASRIITPFDPRCCEKAIHLTFVEPSNETGFGFNETSGFLRTMRKSCILAWILGASLIPGMV
jgi:hypothetical protein